MLRFWWLFTGKKSKKRKGVERLASASDESHPASQSKSGLVVEVGSVANTIHNNKYSKHAKERGT
jgi:hypothetical protein